MSTTADSPADRMLWAVEPGSIEQYWIEYEATRPKYSDSGFLDAVYAYHASKASSDELACFSVAHDVACGAGKAGRELARRFERLVASDSNASSLNAMRLSCAGAPGTTTQKNSNGHDNIEYVLSPAEEIAQHVPRASADLVAVAECVPILNIPVALDNFAAVLKPSGTLAMWFYGRLHFAERAFAAACQPLFDAILEAVFYHIIQGSPPEAHATWIAAAETMESWLDNVHLPPDRWRLVQRHKWNSGSAQMGMGAAVAGLGVVRRSAITAGEAAVIEHEDSEMWRRDFCIVDISRYVLSSFPGISTFVDQDPTVRRLFDELAQAMGGSEARRQVTWPVALILATPCCV